MIVQDILPRLVRDKLWDEDCNGIVFLLGFLGDSFDILDARGDDVSVAGGDIFQSDIWEVIGKFLKNFLVFFSRFFSRNVHGQHFVTDTLSVVNGSYAYPSDIPY